MRSHASLCPYSAKCVEGKFSEVRRDGVLRSSAVRPRGKGHARGLFPTSERGVDGRVGSVDRRYKEGPPPPPPDTAADPEPGMIAKMRGPQCPLSVKNPSFAVCACSLPGITIGYSVKLDASYSPPPPGAARLFSWLYSPNRRRRGFPRTSR